MKKENVLVTGASIGIGLELVSLPTQARVNKKFYEDAPAKHRHRLRGEIEAKALPKYRRERLSVRR